MKECGLTSLMVCINDKICDIRERKMTIRSESWTMNIGSLGFQDSREWVTLWGLILWSLGCNHVGKMINICETKTIGRHIQLGVHEQQSHPNFKVHLSPTHDFFVYWLMPPNHQTPSTNVHRDFWKVFPIPVGYMLTSFGFSLLNRVFFPLKFLYEYW
jgi:hypothetical protein